VRGNPEIVITLDFTQIIDVFQNLRFIGELRQSWEEIKRLKQNDFNIAV
jgi:hypothetical protein